MWRRTHTLARARTPSAFFGVAIGGGLLSTLLIVTEIVLVTRTSALSMGVIGGAKEVLQIGLSVVLLSDAVGPAGAVGIALAVSCSVVYAVLRRRLAAGAAPAYSRVAAGDGEDPARDGDEDEDARVLDTMLEDIVPVRAGGGGGGSCSSSAKGGGRGR